MKKGLVIGKFMPVHNGHLALIEFAKHHCDRLIVSQSFKHDDPIPGQLRFNWIKEIFKEDESIEVAIVKDDFDDETLALLERTKIWASFLRSRYGKIDVIISSEPYGPLLANHLGAESVLYDINRVNFPVSASLIRERPYHYWDYLPCVVRPYYVKKVCFYGPESTGKSVMAKQLAAIYHTEFVPEVARELVSSNDFTIDDIIKIGYAQTERVLEKTKTANKILFCDTDLITTQIYSRYYLGQVPEVLYELEKKITYDQYFLFDIDVPWVADGLRDLGGQRELMMEIFTRELQIRKIPYTMVRGSYEQRQQQIITEVDKLLN
jgi:HTH-type transcriptional repressor of NAD biosynthesis genes